MHISVWWCGYSFLVGLRTTCVLAQSTAFHAWTLVWKTRDNRTSSSPFSTSQLVIQHIILLPNITWNNGNNLYIAVLRLQLVSIFTSPPLGRIRSWRSEAIEKNVGLSVPLFRAEFSNAFSGKRSYKDEVYTSEKV